MCACFQKRTRKIKSDVKDYDLDSDLILWSIKLGFDGQITDDFKKKYDSVIIVRKRILNEIGMAILCLIGFFGMYIYSTYFLVNNDYSNLLTIPCTIFIFLSAFSIIAHMKIVREWIIHDKRMVKEFQTKKMIITDQLKD